MVKRSGLDRHISHYDPLHWSNLPPGIKVLVAYTGVIALFYLLYLLFGITRPISILFGNVFYGTAATVIELASLGLLIAIIYGLIKRHFWVFWVSLAWFSFGALNAIVSLLWFQAEFDALKSILVVSSLVVIVLNGVIVWYVYSEKEYFKVKHLNKETKAKDKFFVHLITVFLIVSFLILLTFGINFYNTTIKTTNKLIAELQAAELPELLCAQKTAQEQDICYLVVSIMKETKEPRICENIRSDFYKITCYRAMGQ